MALWLGRDPLNETSTIKMTPIWRENERMKLHPQIAFRVFWFLVSFEENALKRFKNLSEHYLDLLLLLMRRCKAQSWKYASTFPDKLSLISHARGRLIYLSFNFYSHQLKSNPFKYHKLQPFSIIIFSCGSNSGNGSVGWLVGNH